MGCNGVLDQGAALFQSGNIGLNGQGGPACRFYGLAHTAKFFFPTGGTDHLRSFLRQIFRELFTNTGGGTSNDKCLSVYNQSRIAWKDGADLIKENIIADTKNIIRVLGVLNLFQQVDTCR